MRDLTAVLGMVALTACNNASIEGSWVEPVPGMPGMQQGFVLDGDGSASSINMATLKYEAWKKVGNRLLLSGTSHRQSPEYFLHGYADNRKTDAGQPDSQKRRVALEICQEQ